MNAILRDLERCNAMSALWDDAANALLLRDYDEFERIMHQFRNLKTQSKRDGGGDRNPLPTNNGN